jgi:hypothetical protein
MHPHFISHVLSSIDVRVGDVPPEEPEQAVLYRMLRVTPGEELAAPVRSLMHVPGAKVGSPSCLLALGGQPVDEPDMLHMLHLEPSPDVVSMGRTLLSL